MIPLVVFYLHTVAFAAIFTKRYQAESIGEGFLAVFFMGLIFFVGWAMASFIVKLIVPEHGLATWLDRDAAALLLLTMAEGVLYYFYFKDEHREPSDDAAA
jgi:ABC-type thiamin/hydroxymethylpyrimidine transport system permease subunit